MAKNAICGMEVNDATSLIPALDDLTVVLHIRQSINKGTKSAIDRTNGCHDGG